jgi:hypothetical protein
MIKIFPLDFLGQGALLQPKDSWLHDLAVDFCAREVATEVDLSKFAKVFIAAEIDASEKPMNIEGVTGYVVRPDIALYRAVTDRATAKLHHRWHTFFADNGILGQEVFIHLSNKDTPEQRCASWDEQLKAAQATPADRYLVKVRAK